MTPARIGFSSALCLALLTGEALADESRFAGLRLNQLQLIGTHNSYKRRIDPPLLKKMIALSSKARELDYSHRPLTEQLNMGLRGLEIDIYYDPEGGRFASPKGLAMLRSAGEPAEPYDPNGELRSPGFKVIHIADVDYRSWNLSFEGALQELRTWSEANPGHLPVIVTVNLKEERAKLPGAVEPVPYDATAMDALDAVLREQLGEDRLLTPDRVRGDAPTLEAAVLKRGWPLLDDLRGRFLWVIDESDSKRDLYLEGHPSLRGRVMFTTSPAGTPEAAVMIINNPHRVGKAIRKRVAQGYLVRTRADAGTSEARSGDTSRREAAMASGAHVISTDFPYDEDRFGTGYRVRFPDGYTRKNPHTTE